MVQQYSLAEQGIPKRHATELRVKLSAHQPLGLVQHAHNTFEGNQCHSISRECAQETRYETSPVAFESRLSVDGFCSISPAWKLAIGTKRVCHDALLDDI